MSVLLGTNKNAKKGWGTRIRLRMHLRASATLWLLGALSGPRPSSPNGSAPRADGLAHQKKSKIKGKLFSQNRNTFHLGSLIWVSDKAENASQSIYNPLASGALSGPQTPSHNGSVQRADGPAHQKKGKKKVNCFLKTEVLFIWNHSFGSQVS